MKKYIFLILMVVVLSSCATLVNYQLSLNEIEHPKNPKIPFGNTTNKKIDVDGITKYLYEDSIIKVFWLPLATQFSFTLTNKYSSSIKLIWDDAAYIDENGKTGKIMHAGVKYIDKNNSQPSTTIIKNSSLDDIIVPTDNIYYVSGQYGGWQTAPLFKNKVQSAEEIPALKEKYTGKIVKILIPIKIEDITNDYIFSFKVDDVVKYTK